MGKAVDFLKKNKDVIIAFFASRLMFALLMLISKNSYPTILCLFDAEHYRTIAHYGYISEDITAFFPLIPLIIRFTGDIGLVIINELAFVASLFILKDLIANEYKYKDTQLILLLFALSPVGFFSMLEYTESLFFLFTLGAFALFKKQKYPWLMGILMGLSVMTRSVGALLFFAVFAGMCLNMFRKKTRFVDIVAAYVPATALSLTYPVFLQIAFGKWNAFVESQYTYWIRIHSNVFVTTYWNLRYIFTDKFPHDGIDVMILFKVNEFISLLMMCFIILLVVREIIPMIKNKKVEADSLVLVIFSLLCVIFITSTIRDPLIDCPTDSFYRYYAGMFSIFVMLAKTPFRKDITRIFIYLMVMISIVTSVYFARGVFFF